MSTLNSLNNASHKWQQIEENYRFMMQTGASHEEAIYRLGMTPDQWRQAREAKKQRETRHG